MFKTTQCSAPPRPSTPLENFKYCSQLFLIKFKNFSKPNTFKSSTKLGPTPSHANVLKFEIFDIVSSCF